MLDYRGIEALYTVNKLQSFEKAAHVLHLTQSAVSQRIKNLENYYGAPLLVRALPYRPSALGAKLIAHFKKISLIEQEFNSEVSGELTFPHISIALNRDSLETWFLELIEEENWLKDYQVEIIADDQELTLDYFKSGSTAACLSTSDRPAGGGVAHFLGYMDYTLAASEAFVDRYLSSSFKDQFNEALAIKFDKNDNLHERYLEKFFDLSGAQIPFHVVPSVRAFKLFALKGYGYGLIPKIDIKHELKEGSLIEVFPKKLWRIPLYWHHWEIESKAFKKFNGQLISLAKRKLRAS